VAPERIFWPVEGPASASFMPPLLSEYNLLDDSSVSGAGGGGGGGGGGGIPSVTAVRN